jgi:hypothetical protein
MIRQKVLQCLAACVAGVGFSASVLAAEPITKTAKITLDDAGVLVVDGKKVFPLALTVVPGPDDKAPSGKQAYAEFADAGVMFMRSGKPSWDQETIDNEKKVQAAAAAGGMRCCPWLGWDLSLVAPDDKEGEKKLVDVINTFKDSPGMGLWKAADEPDWGNMQDAKKHTPEEVDNVAKIIHENDPNHPIWLVQAPRGSVERMKRYNDGWDIGGIDIYPISYPPGVHTQRANKDISMVGDWTRWMKAVAGKKPFWMTLQIAFSGTVKPTQTLRMPTFPEQRFMAYEAIISGARGLCYFGGGLPQTFNERDKQYNYNWTYFDKVMRPLFDEIGPQSPIEGALIAPDSQIQLTVKAENPPPRPVATKTEEMKGTPQPPKEYTQDISPDDVSGIEFLTREVGKDIYVLACKREGPTIRVRFSGLPGDFTDVTNTNMAQNKETKDNAVHPGGTVMFEEPRTVEVKDGSFADWFAPYDVHVYKFTRK